MWNHYALIREKKSPRKISIPLNVFYSKISYGFRFNSQSIVSTVLLVDVPPWIVFIWLFDSKSEVDGHVPKDSHLSIRYGAETRKETKPFHPKEDIMEYLLKHSSIKIQEFLTESKYTTPETTSNAISPSALRGYVLNLMFEDWARFKILPALWFPLELHHRENPAYNFL